MKRWHYEVSYHPQVIRYSKEDKFGDKDAGSRGSLVGIKEAPSAHTTEEVIFQIPSTADCLTVSSADCFYVNVRVL